LILYSFLASSSVVRVKRSIAAEPVTYSKVQKVGPSKLTMVIDEANSVTLSGKMTIKRTQKCKEIYNVLCASADKVVIIKSPPFSGKTSFAVCLEHYISTLPPDQIINCKSTSLIAAENGNYEGSSLFAAMKNKSQKMILIIDEVQQSLGTKKNKKLYSGFWEDVKDHLNDKSQTNELRILLLATFTINVENYISRVYTLQFLKFTDEEFAELYALYQSLPGSYVIASDILKMLRAWTGCYCGLVGFFFTALHKRLDLAINRAQIDEVTINVTCFVFLISSYRKFSIFWCMFIPRKLEQHERCPAQSFIGSCL
jgi:hypothetical protein